jgi:predicted GH43/DUF377 family glycosyl hydrolase
MAISTALKRIAKKALQPRLGYFDSSSITLLDSFILNKELLIFYFVKNPFSLGAALVDKLDPNKLLWKTANPIWETKEKIKPLKISKKKSDIIFLFEEKKKTQSVKISLDTILRSTKEIVPVVLERVPVNPILQPNPLNDWEASAVFNSAALYLENNVHFVYRAIMSNGESVLGYASSRDGVHIDQRSNKPIYSYDLANNEKFSDKKFSYGSGGSWAGCEDPRLSLVDDTIYMTYTAFNSCQPPYIELTSILVSDFLKQQWNWKKPLRISPTYEMNKNWVIFPEKINNKYAILHSLTPKILIEYVDRLDDENICVKSHYNPGEKSIYWDNWMRGAGPPPIKTSEGWLLLYHAMDCNDPNRYKLGGMILDYRDPTKVRYRSAYPILEPDAKYENEGFKAGVVYSCGAVIIDETLFVYYGGADTVLCSAFVKLSKILSGIKNSQAPAFSDFKWEQNYA